MRSTALKVVCLGVLAASSVWITASIMAKPHAIPEQQSSPVTESIQEKRIEPRPVPRIAVLETLESFVGEGPGRTRKDRFDVKVVGTHAVIDGGATMAVLRNSNHSYVWRLLVTETANPENKVELVYHKQRFVLPPGELFKADFHEGIDLPPGEYSILLSLFQVEPGTDTTLVPVNDRRFFFEVISGLRKVTIPE